MTTADGSTAGSHDAVVGRHGAAVWWSGEVQAHEPMWRVDTVVRRLRAGLRVMACTRERRVARMASRPQPCRGPTPNSTATALHEARSVYGNEPMPRSVASTDTSKVLR